MLCTAAVTGRVPLWFLFSLPMLYHIVVEDRQKVGWPVHDWLPEASALCCMEVLPYCSLAMRRRYPAEGGSVSAALGTGTTATCFGACLPSSLCRPI
ncbi:hypothetical protein [Dysosmobacter welbionis]|uniref:hypothetical protein n=1 Tax=Dysosmobacter welbionis TaxID=2093857 RepID=UPI00307B8BA1